MVSPSWREEPTHCVPKRSYMLLWSLLVSLFTVSYLPWCELSCLFFFFPLTLLALWEICYISVTKIPEWITWREIIFGFQFQKIWSILWGKCGRAWHGRCPDLKEFLPKEKREEKGGQVKASLQVTGENLSFPWWHTYAWKRAIAPFAGRHLETWVLPLAMPRLW